MKHVAKKRFGQNFLNDQTIITSLVDAIAPHADDLMVEIGPGLGALTQPLLKKLDHLHVVEIDRDIISWMKGHYAAGKLTKTAWCAITGLGFPAITVAPGQFLLKDLGLLAVSLWIATDAARRLRAQ